MSQLQGQELSSVLISNSSLNGLVNLKERPSNGLSMGYWPGHVVAECLIDDDINNNNSITSNNNNNNKTNDSNNNRLIKNRSNSDSASKNQKLNRTNSKNSNSSITNGDLMNNNNNNKNETNLFNHANNENNEIIRATKILTKIKPGCAFSAIISSMVPLDILTKSLRLESIMSSSVDRRKSSPESNNANNNNNIDLDDDYVYDEFGFKIEREEHLEHSQFNPNNNNNNQQQQQHHQVEEFINIRLSPCPNSCRRTITDEPFVEDSKHKLKWIAYLEFTLNADIGSSFSWDQVTSLNKCEKLKLMIRGQGVPHSLRPFVWMRLSGALQKKLNSKFKYTDIVKSTEHDQFLTSKQIEKDLLRTLPSNACFTSLNSVGIPRLRRILQSIAWLYPNIGYCQGMGTIAATLLLFLEEEDAFWLMCCIIEDILPVSYYSHTLLGVQADMKVLRQLVSTYLPEVELQFKKHDIELSLVCINWFLTIFSNVFHIRILLRVWDLFFYDGSSAMFQITLAMLKLNEKNLKEAQSSSQIFTILSDIPGEMCDIDLLVETSIRVASSVNKGQLDTMRRKHQAYLMAQNGSIINPSNYQNLPITKEKPHLRNLENKSKNFLKMFRKSLKGNSSNKNDINNNNNNSNSSNNSNIDNEINNFRKIKAIGSDSFNNALYDDSNDAKMKNILQTEFLVNLREIIIKIAHHFQTYDTEHYSKCDLNADYSIESHSQDIENYMDTSKVRQFKRAKALLDFEKTDDDELGFHKNDIITVLSTKDDHCWIGELNGEKGWFPSRFVCLIDERNGKIYSAAGDDSVNDRVRDLIRGEFALAMKSIFEHGLKKWTVLGGTMHPWSFIEEAAKKTIEKDFYSVYSRLVLCKTFRLDEDGKVLTPDELLFRSIQLINLSHDSYRAHQDVKFRSLICIGLNEQVLHIWLETLCSAMEAVEKWYHPWSFIRSPGWVQIKCELRLLSQFSFLLNPDSELPENRKEIAINECIKDMLIKHHLFSWDIN